MFSIKSWTILVLIEGLACLPFVPHLAPHPFVRARWVRAGPCLHLVARGADTNEWGAEADVPPAIQMPFK